MGNQVAAYVELKEERLPSSVWSTRRVQLKHPRGPVIDSPVPSPSAPLKDFGQGEDVLPVPEVFSMMRK